MLANFADLIAFLKCFHAPLLAGPSLDAADMPADLPPGLATLHRELGRLIELEYSPDGAWRPPFGTQDRLLPLKRLKWIDGLVEFAVENSGNWAARCPLGMPDPPVYSDAADGWSDTRRGFVVVCESLNHFLTTLCLQEAVMGSPNLLCVETDRPLDQVVTAPLQPLWLNGYLVTGDPDRHFHVTAERDVIVMDLHRPYVGSRARDVAGLVAQGLKFQAV